MNKSQKNGRYQRIYKQAAELFEPVTDPIARMATIAAILHHKFNYYFWTGFYLLKENQLIVGPYQGPLACMKLKNDTGVCWACINQGKTIVVDDVEQFPGHIACSSLSKSEIVVPVKNKDGQVVAVIDVDSKEKSSFDEEDANGLEQLIKLIYND